MTEALEARLQRMEDLMEIHQLFIDYGMHLDAGRFDEYSNLFATDGQIRLGPLGKAQGRDAIRETLTASRPVSTGRRLRANVTWSWSALRKSIRPSRSMSPGSTTLLSARKP